MTRYIVDASVVIQRLIVEKHTPNVIEMFAQTRGVDELYTAMFCRLECVNVIWKHVRFQNMPQPHAENLVRALRALRVRSLPVHSLHTDALQIGLRHQLAIYDSVYIALARQLGYPLITADQRQATAAATENVTVKAITDFVQ